MDDFKKDLESVNTAMGPGDTDKKKPKKDTTQDEDEVAYELEKAEQEMKEDALEGDIPMLVFPWTYPPWKWVKFFTPLFLTFCLLLASFEVFACNYGWAEQACTPMGVITFIACLFALNQLQKLGTMERERKKMEMEMRKLKDIMDRYKQENKLLQQTLGRLEEQADVLKEESAKLGVFTQDLNKTTDRFEYGVREFKRERLNLNKTFTDIIEIVDSLNANETDLQNRCGILRRELRKLRVHNKAIAQTYNNLVEEHEGVRQTNKEMGQQIMKFEEMRQKFLDQRDVLKNSIHGNLMGLNSMMDNYQILFLQEIAHNAEFMDQTPGMTTAKFEEFLRRLPAHIQVSKSKLSELFMQLADANMVCDHKAMHRIIVEIVKVNKGPGTGQEPYPVPGEMGRPDNSAFVNL